MPAGSFSFLLLLLFSVTCLPAQSAAEPYLVKDINQTDNKVTRDSDPMYLTHVFPNLFFTAEDDIHGRELWVSDGSAYGTNMVMDINPFGNGAGSGVRLGNELFFGGYDPQHGGELWKSDGTLEGTGLVIDLFPGPESSEISSLTRVNNLLFFLAKVPDGASWEVGLWRSDGTPEGTFMLKNVTGPLPNNYPPGNLTSSGGVLYFTFMEMNQEYALWKTNGTVEGTELVEGGLWAVTNLTDVNGKLFFNADKKRVDLRRGLELWVHDVTALPGQQTHMVKNIYPDNDVNNLHSSNPKQLTNVLGTLFFTANDGEINGALWKSDGTEEGTVRVSEIVPRASSGPNGHLTAVSHTLFFTATDGINGMELWKSDGTAEGTVMVKDLAEGPSGSHPYELISALVFIPDENIGGLGCNIDLFECENRLYFFASSGGRVNLWKSDGTEEGTVIISSSYFSAPPKQLVNANFSLFFVANDMAHGSELWRSDGTEAGTAMVKDIMGIGSSSPSEAQDVNGLLFFNTFNWTYGDELWKSDGTEEGTSLIKDIYPGKISKWGDYWPNDGEPGNFVKLGNLLLFSGYTSSLGQELWRSDGTASGTYLVKNINPATSTTSTGTIGGSANINFMTRLNDTAFFMADDGVHGRELWKTDGTGDGTRMVKDIVPGVADSYPVYLTPMGDSLYFAAHSGVNYSQQNRLFKTDGTMENTVLLKDVRVMSNLVGMCDTFYFYGEAWLQAENRSIRAIWRSDGTEEGTFPLVEIAGGIYSFADGLYAAGSKLFFQLQNDAYGIELWTSDGTAEGTFMLADINPGEAHSRPSNITVLNNKVYFIANDGSGRDLWVSDGNTDGTYKLFDGPVAPDSPGYPQAFAVISGNLFFTAFSYETGWEPYVYSPYLNEIISFDLEPGLRSSLSGHFVRSGDLIYFYAFTSVTGYELWAMPVDADLDGIPDTQDGSILAADDPAVEVCTDTDDDGIPDSIDPDDDNDGYPDDVDCSATDPAVNPGVQETCDGIDNNCDGKIDESGYILGDFLQPINQDGSSIFKTGRTIPVKIAVANCYNFPISTASLNISVVKITDQVLGSVEEVEIDASGNANTGTLFRYDVDEQFYIYNLSTKGFSAGTYEIKATAENGQGKTVTFSLK